MTVYPSIQVEVGLSDSLLENHRDCSLWVTSTNLEVCALFILNRLLALGKIAIGLKITLDDGGAITKLLFQLYEFDFDCRSSTTPFGREYLRATLLY